MVWIIRFKRAKVNSEVMQKSPETSRSGDISKTKVTLTYADALTSPPVRDAQGQNDHRRLTPSKLRLERGQKPSSLKGQRPVNSRLLYVRYM